MPLEHISTTAGYDRVGVDEVLKGYETLELDMDGGEGEKSRVLSFYGKRNTSCLQTPPLHGLLLVAIHLSKVHPSPIGTPARVHLDLRRVGRLRPLSA